MCPITVGHTSKWKGNDGDDDRKAFEAKFAEFAFR